MDRILVQAASNFIACRPKAVVLYWYFGVLDVVCVYVLLFLLDIKLGNRLKLVLNVGLACDQCGN